MDEEMRELAIADAEKSFEDWLHDIGQSLNTEFGIPDEMELIREVVARRLELVDPNKGKS